VICGEVNYAFKRVNWMLISSIIYAIELSRCLENIVFLKWNSEVIYCVFAYRCLWICCFSVQILAVVYRVSATQCQPHETHRVFICTKNIITLWLPVTITYQRQKHWKFLKSSKPCNIGIHLNVLNESFHMNAYVAGFQWTFKEFRNVLLWSESQSAVKGF